MPVRAFECSHAFPQDMQHFVACVFYGKQPLETGEDGRAVLAIILAACESAGTGQHIEWLWEAPRGNTQIQMWGR